MSKGGFTKFTVSEKVEALEVSRQEKISTFLRVAGKTSVNELTDDEKEQLNRELDSA